MILRGPLIACVVLLLSSCNASLPPPRAYPLAHHKTLYMSAWYANSAETFMFTSISASVPEGTPAAIVVSSKAFTFQCQGDFISYGDPGNPEINPVIALAGPPGQYTISVNIPGYGIGAYRVTVLRRVAPDVYYVPNGCTGVYPPGVHTGSNPTPPMAVQRPS